MRAPLLVLALAACDGGAAAPDTPPRQIVTETRLLLIGEIAEGTLTGGPADAARVTLTAPAPKLDWNLHGHAGGGTQTIQEELGVTSATYLFIPPEAGPWLLLLRNRDTAPMSVEVQLELYGDMQWSGWP